MPVLCKASVEVGWESVQVILIHLVGKLRCKVHLKINGSESSTNWKIWVHSGLVQALVLEFHFMHSLLEESHDGLE
jgi:hypothetical protein